MVKKNIKQSVKKKNISNSISKKLSKKTVSPKTTIKKNVRKATSLKKSISKTIIIKESVRKETIVVTSGGFDPIHIGHIRLINEAKKLGDKLIVILNNDNWIELKKGVPFMPQEERKEILEALESVDEVIYSSHTKGTKDMSIIKDLEKIRPHIFAKGGDRYVGNIPESAVCDAIGCKIISDIGHGGKVQSSSWLISKAKEHAKHIAEKQNKQPVKKV